MVSDLNTNKDLKRVQGKPSREKKRLISPNKRTSLSPLKEELDQDKANLTGEGNETLLQSKEEGGLQNTWNQEPPTRGN